MSKFTDSDCPTCVFEGDHNPTDCPIALRDDRIAALESENQRLRDVKIAARFLLENMHPQGICQIATVDRLRTAIEGATA